MAKNVVVFTGTKFGMRVEQWKTVQIVLTKLFRTNSRFHHGDCVGGDVEAAEIAHRLGYLIVCHPPTIETKRGWFEHNDITLPSFDYVIRDRHIVDDSKILVAAPHTPYEIIRSGTWTTVRYAREKRRPIYLVTPSGNLKTENISSEA